MTGHIINNISIDIIHGFIVGINMQQVTLHHGEDSTVGEFKANTLEDGSHPILGIYSARFGSTTHELHMSVPAKALLVQFLSHVFCW